MFKSNYSPAGLVEIRKKVLFNKDTGYRVIQELMPVRETIIPNFYFIY